MKCCKCPCHHKDVDCHYCQCHEEPESTEKCDYMILTPTPDHNGGMWCAENYPCKKHGEWKETQSTWQEEFKHNFFDSDGDVCPEDCDLQIMINFIQQLLIKEREAERTRIVKLVEGMKIEGCACITEICMSNKCKTVNSYNQALRDIINKIQQ